MSFLTLASVPMGAMNQSITAFSDDRLRNPNLILFEDAEHLLALLTPARLEIIRLLRNFESFALHPDLRIFCKVSIFQRMAYQSSFWIASARDRAWRLISSFHSVLGRSGGALRSCA